MRKKDPLRSPAPANNEEAFRCGECLHYAASPHRKNEAVCSKLGIRSFALSPSCYTPDYTRIVQHSDQFLMIANFFANSSPVQKKIFLGMLRQKSSGKRLKMGTKMFLHTGRGDYISNYICGFVVGYSSSGEIVLSGSQNSTTQGRVFFAYLQNDESLLSVRDWAIRFEELKKSGRIQDPDQVNRRNITQTVREDRYEVPTIDSAPVEDLPRRRGRPDLVDTLVF